MSFWHESSMQPKRNYRFQVIISLLSGGTAANGSDSIIWWVKNFKPPSYSITEATHEYMDNKYYWPGRVSWEECTMQLVDPVSPNAVALTNKIIQNSGYVIKDDASTDTNLQTISKANAVAAMGVIEVNILSADGTPIESWTLNNPFIKSVSFSNLDYTSDDLRTIDISFRYDYATCTNYRYDSANQTYIEDESQLGSQFNAGDNYTTRGGGAAATSSEEEGG